jgi:hypothetical protein
MKYAHFFDADSGAVHRIPRKKFEKIQDEAQKKIDAGIARDVASNEMHEELCRFPIALYIDWVERVL